MSFPVHVSGRSSAAKRFSMTICHCSCAFLRFSQRFIQFIKVFPMNFPERVPDRDEDFEDPSDLLPPTHLSVFCNDLNRKCRAERFLIILQHTYRCFATIWTESVEQNGFWSSSNTLIGVSQRFGKKVSSRMVFDHPPTHLSMFCNGLNRNCRAERFWIILQHTYRCFATVWTESVEQNGFGPSSNTLIGVLQRFEQQNGSW